MADRIQLRRDTAANWTNYNPILLEGEPGIELDTDQWKLGDGIHNWNDLPHRGGPYVQQRGQSTTAAMSQKAVTDELNLIAVFDISAYNLTDGQPTKYADLAAALGTNGVNVPESYRRGGMTVKYVQSSDNKYVQARCMAQSFTTDVTQWQGIDDTPTAGSNNLVKSGGVEKNNGSIRHKDDAMLAIHHNGGSSTESSTGNKYSWIFYVSKGTRIYGKTSWGRMYMGIFDTPTHALTNTGLIEEIHGYTIDEINGVAHYDGYLRVIISKSNNGNISEEEVAELVAATTIRIFNYGEVTETMLEYNVDSEPKFDSDRLLSSSSVAKLMHYFENSKNIKFALVDNNYNIISYIDGGDKWRFLLDLFVEKINDVTQPVIVEDGSTVNKNLKWVWEDNDGNIILAVTKDDKFASNLLDFSKLYDIIENGFDPEHSDFSEFYLRNRSMEPILLNDCLYDYNPSFNQGEDLSQNTLRKKRLQLSLVTDTHMAADTFQNVVDAANDFVSIDAAIHLGDFCNFCYLEADTYEKTLETINSSKKPLYMSPGNHDWGHYSVYVRYCKDNKQLYNRFVKPSVDKGWLKDARPSYTYKKNGSNVSFPKVSEWQENKVYYYHDFDEFKIRLIVLYPVDDGDVTQELNAGKDNSNSMFDRTYWKPVAYNSSYSTIENKSYVVGDKINVPGYETYSFECVQNVEVTRIEGGNGNFNSDFVKNPRFKASRRPIWYGQEQLEWFCDRLEEAGEHGYTCVVCQHYMMATRNYTRDTNTRFNNPNRRLDHAYTYRFQANEKDIIAQIVYAYQTKGTITKSLSAISTYIDGQTGNPDAYDDTSCIPSMSLNRTFSYNGENNKVLLLHGHIHGDEVVRSNDFGITDIGFVSGTPFNVKDADINRTNTVEGRDLVTCVTVYDGGTDGYVHLSRIGNTLTNRIDPVTNALVRKDNEIINF